MSVDIYGLCTSLPFSLDKGKILAWIYMDYVQVAIFYNQKHTNTQYADCTTHSSKEQVTAQTETTINFSCYLCSLPTKFQPPFALKSSITPSRSWQFLFSNSFASSLDSSDQCRAQNVPLKITCRYELGMALLNTSSFFVNHMAQQKATAPTNNDFLRLWVKPANQGPTNVQH